MTDKEPWIDADSVRRAEVNNDLTLRMPGLGTILTIFGRAFTLRCPHCGGRPVFRTWFKLRERCGACDRTLERGEHDYFLGGMLFNLIMAELLFTGGFVAFMIARWPDVPWDTIQFAAPLGMLVMPALLYPFSKLVWLGFDLALRPRREG